MKLRNLTIALALLVPATASAGPIQPSAIVLNDTEIADLGPSSEPITGSQSQSVETLAALVTSSHYVYETSFHVSLSSFSSWIPPTPGGENTPPRQEQPLQPQPVPEPSTLLLVGSSLAVAAVRKARARRQQLADVQ
jgi:PEP-CTERM motif-containing protein